MVIILKIFYLFIFRERGRQGEKHRYARGTAISHLSHTPTWGPSPQPRHVPWLGIEPVILWSAGRHSIHWATPGRAILVIILSEQNKMWLVKSYHTYLYTYPYAMCIYFTKGIKSFPFYIMTLLNYMDI